MVKKRTLTPEEEKLWQHITRHDRKLSRAQREEAAPAPEKKKKTIRPEPAAAPPVAPKSKTTRKEPKPPVRGQYAGVDANTADRFRKGKYAIDATLDLHGMTREKARRSLLAFIESHWNRGSRCLLVITGKGLRTTGEDGQPRGVLREALPEWLAGENMGRMVLAFDVAKQQHGGTGACYILLRRKR